MKSPESASAPEPAAATGPDLSLLLPTLDEMRAPIAELDWQQEISEERPAAAPADPSPAPAQTSAAPATAPEETPQWLQVGGEIRGRAEGITGLGFTPDRDTGYYLNRIRLNAKITVLPWLRIFGQAQDSQAPGYYAHPAPGTVVNTLDLRQAYVELGRTEKGPWGLRVGRQELIFGDERLVGASNWGNVGRTFDAARMSYSKGPIYMDLFSSSVVVPVSGHFDHHLQGSNLHGFYSGFKNWIPQAVVEAYVFLKTAPTVGEIGGKGALGLFTYGTRLVGKLPARMDYNVEMAFQQGHAGKDSVGAWAGHWNLGYALSGNAARPKLVAEYNYASGDHNPADGHRGTFDQLFPTNHNKYGTADVIAWRNVHDVMTGLEWKPRPKWKLNADYHNFWLADRADALYTEAGAAAVRNAKATSSFIGQEFDFQALYSYGKQLQLGAGYAYLFAGEYLKQSTKGSNLSQPYVMWNYRF